MSPTILNVYRKPISGMYAKEYSWFLPFKESDKSLENAYDNGSISTLKQVSFRPSIDTSKTNSIYVEVASYIPNNILRIGLGTNVTQSSLNDSTKTKEEIAFQKITNGGGNIVLNLSRPLIYFDSFIKDANGFLVANIGLAGYADIENLNQDIYNPGMGALFNTSFDFRIYNNPYSSNEKKKGNLFRIGLSGSFQYSLANEKYNDKNNIDKMFNELAVTSIGGYIGLAMFNIQFTYNIYNKNESFFDEKKTLLKIEVVPIKF